MAVKKSELYSTLWEACNKLRGGVEPARYKDYVLVLLFHKYVSDRNKGKIFGEFKVTEATSFDALIRLKGDNDIGEKVTTVLQQFLIDNGLVDIPVNFNNPSELGEGKELVDKVSGLIALFENPALDFRNNTSDGDDLIGDAYEYFMMKFAQESGKSKGQFYTPGEVSRVIARLIGIDSIKHIPGKYWTLYDPACGSGSLLIRADDEAPSDCSVSIYGQEKDISTAGLAKMNLVLHGKPTGEIERGSTLAAPKFFDIIPAFDFIVMNPPFSDKSWSDGINLKAENDKDKDTRFTLYGTPPAKNGDYAWFIHVLSSLNATGKAGIVMPHGVLFRGNAEEDIRRKILMTRCIKGVISLPPNLFYGTGIPACIILIDKENAQGRTGIFFIDAGEGFRKDGSKNRLREQDIEKIVRVFRSGEEIEGYSRFVSYDEILRRNDGNLNVPRYIQRPDGELPQNIAAHLYGGIPKSDVDSLSGLWAVSPELKGKIFADSGGERYTLAVRPEEISGLIMNDESIDAQRRKECGEIFGSWREEADVKLMAVDGKTAPKKLIRELGDDLLEKFSESVFAGKYEVFDCLMNYWNDKMQDDVYLVMSEGWEKAGRMIEYERTDKGKVKSWEGGVIPREVMEREYFSELAEKIRMCEEESAGLAGELEAIREEYPESEDMPEEESERMKSLADGRAKADREARKLRKELDGEVLKKYAVLTEEEVRRLVFSVKWMGHIARGIAGEFERVLGWYVMRVEEMGRRYERKLGEIESEVEGSGREVREALGRMGYAW